MSVCFVSVSLWSGQNWRFAWFGRRRWARQLGTGWALSALGGKEYWNSSCRNALMFFLAFLKDLEPVDQNLSVHHLLFQETSPAFRFSNAVFVLSRWHFKFRNWPFFQCQDRSWKCVATIYLCELSAVQEGRFFIHHLYWVIWVLRLIILAAGWRYGDPEGTGVYLGWKKPIRSSKRIPAHLG